MRTILRFVFRFLAIRSSITTASVSLTLLVGLSWWILGRDGKAALTQPPQAASGFLYILNECKAPCENQILGFAVDEATGSLTPLPDFPVPTGGIGTDSSRERLAIDKRHNRLFAINDGSKTISAFTIVPETGKLTAFLTIPLPTIRNGGSWTTIAVQPTCGTLLVVGDLPSNFQGHLASFQIMATNAAPFGAVQTTAGVVSRSITFSRNGKYVYTGGGGFSRKFAGFSIAATGLKPLSGSPFESGSANPVAYVTDDQRRLFMVNEFFQEQQLRVFATTNGIPGPTPTPSPRLAGLREAGQGLLHPNGFYIVSDSLFGADRVGVYKISGSGSTTTLNPVPGSPFHSGGSQINLLALNHDGKFLFAVNTNFRNITTFSVNTTSGALTNIRTQPQSTLGLQGGFAGIAYLPPPEPQTEAPTSITIDAPTVSLGFPSGGTSAPVRIKVISQCTPFGEVKLAVEGKPFVTKALLPDGSAIFNVVVPRVKGPVNLHAEFRAQNGFGSSSATGVLKVTDVKPLVSAPVKP